MGEVKPGFYFQSSAPLVARDYIIIGGWVVDNYSRGEPSGVIRAFDATTGALAWAWDLGVCDCVAVIGKRGLEAQRYTKPAFEHVPNLALRAAMRVYGCDVSLTAEEIFGSLH